MVNDLIWVYHDTALAAVVSDLPGVRLYGVLENADSVVKDGDQLRIKLEQSCGKLCLMWQAGDWALDAEREFWMSTVRESPALFGAEKVTVHYHLEAFVLFARSALDVAAHVFGALLPAPFARDRFDSFNKLVKTVATSGPQELNAYFGPLRGSNTSWLSVISGSERGRSLRDKISHQTEFPLQYAELYPPLEKEYAVVRLSGVLTPLPDFINMVRNGVIEGFRKMEEMCVQAMTTA
jgi:hypothetical protein